MKLTATTKTPLSMVKTKASPTGFPPHGRELLSSSVLMGR